MSNTPAMSSKQKIAIVGIGCRFAGGVDNVEEFWKALSEGRDCSSPLPQDRFDVAAFYHPDLKKNGRLYCERGGFLKHDVLKFDRQFFKIPPDEAEQLDPQVRLLLEVTQEALEDAGMPPKSMKGSNTGVFMGVTACEYQALNTSPVSHITQYTNSGTNSCMMANRISYEYDLNGPSFSVDTACSSSLYTTHLACEAIRRGECNMALAGGVNLLLMPNTSIGFCQAGMLSPDGRCKSFDASADGYSRGEGAGVIILKPLDRARADNDRIYAVFRGGALTNDGHTPGIANPSYAAQVELVRRACANAAVAYADIPYVEAHGTGTQVGDTTEANALGQTIGTARKSRNTPLYLGSVKSNISHCEGSAGIAGVIKTALALQHRQIPPVVHFKRGNDKIKFDEYNLKIPQKLEPWPNKDKALAGVSSFGFGGANAHLILEGIPADSANSSVGRREQNMPFVKPLVISSQTKDGLTENATKWISHLRNSEDSFHDILSTAAIRRQHYGHRVGVLCRSRDDAIAGLEAFIEDSGRTLYIDGHVPDAQVGSANRLVFVFNGMGTQWFGMGQALLQAESVFRETILKFDKVLKTLKCRWSVMEQLENSQFKDRIHETEYAQPTICAVQMALTELLKKYDVIPDVVIGHSVGEVAAAYACAKLSFQNAVYVIYERARALKKTSGSGTMLAARVSQQEAEEIRATNDAIFAQVDIAAVNSESQTVLSGTRDALDAFAAVLRDKGARNTFLNVQNAFHSSQQEPLRKHVLKKFAKLHRSRADTDPPSIAMMSTVTADYVSPEQVNGADYWWRNIRYMVHFKDAIERLLEDGYSHFLEIGAHPALMSVIRDIIASSKEKPKKFSVLPTLRRKDDPTSSFDGQFHIMSTLLQLFCEHDHNSLPVVFSEEYNVVSLPTYQWQRGECGEYPSLSRELHLFPDHRLLGRKIAIPVIARKGTTRKIMWHQPAASVAKTPWIADHVIQGATVLPAVGYTDMMLEIANELRDGDARLRVRNLRFEKFLFFPTNGDVELLTMASSEPGSDDKLWSVGVWSKTSSGEWVQHARGEIDLRADDVDDDDQPATISRGNTLIRLPVEKLRLRCMHESDADYRNLIKNGFHLGPSFRSVKTILINDDATEALLYADAPKEILHDFRDYAYHPAFFDGILHGYIMMVIDGGEMLAKRRNEPVHYSTEIPYSFGEVELYGEPAEKTVMHVKSYMRAGIRYADVRAADLNTNIIYCVMTGIRFDPLPDANNNDALHTWSLSWQPFNIDDHPRDTGTRVDKVVLICDNGEDANRMAEAMKREGASEVRWVSTRQLDELPRKCGHLTPNDAIVLYFDTTEEDCSQMDADQFARAIDDICVTAASLLLKVKDIFPDTPPKMWMVTRGATYVQTGDTPRPCLNTVHSVALTAVHEFYLNPTSSVDLSQDTDLAGDAVILARLVVPPLLPENEFAIRPTTDGEAKILVRRLTKSLATDMKSTSVPWQLPLDGDTIRVIESPEETGSSKFHCPEVDVNVETFSVVVVNGATKAVVCGVVDAIHPEVQLVQPGDKVVALCEGVLERKMRLSPREVVRVPPNVGESADILCQLHSFLPGLYLCNGGDILRNESKLAIYSPKTSVEECSMLAEVLRRQGHPVTLFTKQTLTEKDGNRPAEVYDALIAMEADSLTEPATEGLLSSVRKFGTIVIYMADGEEAVPSQGTLLHNKRLVLLSKSAVWQTDEFPVLATRMFAILEDSDQKALPCFDARAAWHRRQELSAAIGQSVSDVVKEKSVTLVDGKCPVPLSFDGNRFHPNGNAMYIITGGMKGFGMATVKWLFSKGVKHMAIIGRSEATPEQKTDIAALEEAGCHIYVFKADVSNYKRMEVVIDNLQRKPHPIEGIFHSAVVFRDAWLAEMTREDWMQVMMPKAYGAVVLHQLSIRKNLPLQHFVTYSSIVGMVGNSTQGNYCVSNAFLLSLGDLRRTLGLPSSVACFGVINSTGFAHRNELVAMYDKKGMYSVSPKNALNAVATLMSLNVDHLGITAAFDSNKFAEAYRGAMTQNENISGGFLSRFKNIMDGVTMGNAEGKGLMDRLREATSDEGKEIVMGHLTSSLAKLLGINEADVSVDSSPVNLGVDSLMATDLSNDIMNAFEIQFLPVELLNDKTTLLAVCHSIYTKALAGQGSSETETRVENGKIQTHSTWVRKVNNPVNVHAQIVCFPPNGGGSTNFRNWPSNLEKHGWEMFLVQPPGWEARFTETPVDDLQEMVRSVSGELTQLLRPDSFVFYGHSLGALLAFESAHFLQENHKLCPRHLYVAAWSAPTIPYQHPHNVPLDVFEPSTPTHILTSYVPRFTYLDPRLASNPAIMKRLKPCLAAGTKMCNAYSCEHADRLPCNITALSGNSDLFAPSTKMAGWANMTDRKYKFRSKVYRGAHMFLQDPDVSKTVVAKIKADLDKSRHT